MAAAVDAYFSAIPVATSVTGLTSYEFSYIKNAGVWFMQKLTIANNGNITVNFTVSAVVPTFPSCDSTVAFFDGMQIGWGVVAAMAAALAIIFLKNSLFQR